MDLVGAWLRQLVRAGTAAAIVPAAMVAALVVVLVGAGGLGGLGSIGQLVAGPQISPADEVSSRATPVRDLAPVAPAAAPEPDPAARAPRPAPAAPPQRAAPPPPPAVRPAPPPPLAPPPPAPAPAPIPPPPPAAVAPPAPPAVPARPTLRDTTKQLTGQLGQAVDGVVAGVKRIIDGLGPPNVRGLVRR